jgi:S1-C subfamily serine protease
MLADQPVTSLRNATRATISSNPGWSKAILGVTMVADAAKCVIASVAHESVAQQAGLSIDDVIVQVNEHEISSSSDLVQVIGRYRPGDEISIQLLRGDVPLEITMKLGGVKNQ